MAKSQLATSKEWFHLRFAFLDGSVIDNGISLVYRLAHGLTIFPHPQLVPPGPAEVKRSPRELLSVSVHLSQEDPQTAQLTAYSSLPCSKSLF